MHGPYTAQVKTRTRRAARRRDGRAFPVARVNGYDNARGWMPLAGGGRVRAILPAE